MQKLWKESQSNWNVKVSRDKCILDKEQMNIRQQSLQNSQFL